MVTRAVYTHEPGSPGKLISQHRSGTTNYYLYDALGSTRALADSAGTITDTYSYQAYGTQISESGSTPNNYRYVGRYGYYYDYQAPSVPLHVRARNLATIQARFTSTDALVIHPSGVNQYTYAQNNPLNMIDPSGRIVVEPWPTDPDFPQQERALCSEEQQKWLFSIIKRACDLINSDKGARCLGPRIRDCLRSLCNAKLVIQCLRRCSGPPCAYARLWDPARRDFPPYPVRGTCLPILRGRGQELSITFCMNNLQRPKPCGSSPIGIVLHELVHLCDNSHAYDGFGGQPEACERACLPM